MCRRLKVLKCSHNRLGAAPAAMGNCYKLELVDLSHNNLSAPIPGAAVRLLLGLTDLNLRFRRRPRCESAAAARFSLLCCFA